jgi:hypothetical protein
MGHFKRECPKLGSPTGEKRVTFLGNKEDLPLETYPADSSPPFLLL